MSDHLEIWDRAAWRKELNEVEGSAEDVAERLAANETDHVPVLAEEVRELLAIQPGETVVDATFGAGGHAALLAADLRGDGKLHRDRPRPDRAPVLRALPPRTRACSRASCAASPRSCSTSWPRTASRADAILLDLGVSSMQLDRPERGFSYAADAPLDMRMDPTAELPPPTSSTRRPSAS